MSIGVSDACDVTPRLRVCLLRLAILLGRTAQVLLGLCQTLIYLTLFSIWAKLRFYLGNINWLLEFSWRNLVSFLLLLHLQLLFFVIPCCRSARFKNWELWSWILADLVALIEDKTFVTRYKPIPTETFRLRLKLLCSVTYFTFSSASLVDREAWGYWVSPPMLVLLLAVVLCTCP